MIPNFVEYETVDGANQVDLKAWRFVGLKNGCYVFARRIKRVEPR